MHHPQVGELDLYYENLQIAGTDGQTLVIYHADPGSRTAQALALLATLTADSSHGSAPTEEAAVSAPTGAEPQHRPVIEPQPQRN
jgi:hypothetical protein